jgi:hypothetical protein
MKANQIARRWWAEERTIWRNTGDINARKSMRRAADARLVKKKRMAAMPNVES